MIGKTREGPCKRMRVLTGGDKIKKYVRLIVCHELFVITMYVLSCPLQLEILEFNKIYPIKIDLI